MASEAPIVRRRVTLQTIDRPTRKALSRSPSLSSLAPTAASSGNPSPRPPSEGSGSERAPRSSSRAAARLGGALRLARSKTLGSLPATPTDKPSTSKRASLREVKRESLNDGRASELKRNPTRRKTLPVRLEVSDKYDRDTARKEAIRVLATSAGSTLPLAELADSLLKPLLKPDGSKAFAPEQITDAVEAVLLLPAGKTASPPELIGPVIEALAASIGSRFASVAGQVLWQHRGIKVLQSPDYRAVVEDPSWVEELDVGITKSVWDQIDSVFQDCAAEGGLLKFMGWQKVVHYIEINPVLKSRLKMSDVDRLFWTCTRRNGLHRGGIGRKDFKRVLLELAETMDVHPFMVALAIGSHASPGADPEEQAQPEDGA